MTKSDVLTIRIEEDLSQRLSLIASGIGLTRADYLRMVLRMASTVDPQDLRKVMDDGLKSQMLKTH